MDRLLTLKTELQKNFEVLKQEHEELKNSNDEYESERKMLLNSIGERDSKIEKLTAEKTDYETLNHKYLNLEKVHSLLRDNAEKFQEENQDLHEEVFKLQEQVTKYEHELELVSKDSEMSNMVPRDNYEQLLKELNELKERRGSDKVLLEETNIDDNAKVVIERLKREISELKHKLSEEKTNQMDEHNKPVQPDKIMQLYNKYINFDIPVDYIGEIPSSDDNIVLFKLESIFKTLNSFKKNIDTLEYQLSEKNHNINHMQTQIDDLTSENDFLTLDIQQFESELNEMKKNNDFLLNELTTLKNTSKLQPIMESHEENVVKLENELDNCTQLNKNFESEIKAIRKELDEVKNEKTVLHASLTDMRNKYTVMLSELENVKTQTQAVNELENSTKPGTHEQLKINIDEIDELKKKLNASNSKNEQLSIDIHIIENDKVLLTKKVDDLKHDLAETTSARKSMEEYKLSLDNQLQDLNVKLNEVLTINKEHENERTRLQEKALKDKDQLTEKIQQLSKENSTLKETIEKLTTDISNLKAIEIKLKEDNQTLVNNTQSKCENTNELHETIKDLKAKTVHQEILNDEISSLKQENHVLIEKKLELEASLISTDTKIAHLEEEFDKIVTELNEKDTIIDTMNSTITENNIKLNDMNDTVNSLNTTLEIKNDELLRLTKALNEATDKLNNTSSNLDRGFDELKRLEVEKEEMHKNIMNLQEEIESKNAQISSMNAYTEELNKRVIDCKATIDSKDKELKEFKQSIAELTDKLKATENCSQLNDEYTHLIHEKETIEKEVTDLKNYLTSKEIEVTDAKEKIEWLEKSCDEYKNTLENATKEKAELINLVNLKHNESIQYHNEIQRLNHVILEQTNEFKKVIEEKDTLLQNTSLSCLNCENLRITLKEKDEIIKTLNQNTTDYERVKTELNQANDTIRSLSERCENLDKSMAIQLETVKNLTAQHAQLSEQEQGSIKELERLRRHLVETEENYTQELMTSEQKLTECQTRLHQIEERAKQTSTVYTSNSIRANQEVETLRNQYKLLEKQRDDVQVKLSEAEDARGRSEAALTNLQVVLEQFQLDKERDIHSATEKIRHKMDDLRRENLTLQEEITRLNTKLEEASNGLQAAFRLGDQVETKTAQINDLKEQVKALQSSVAAAEERYYNATTNQQDKVDKNLVKNLVVNYVMTASSNMSSKTQVLRILSTVLDFNQQECEKLGLSRAANAPDSLAAEFVKFLQNESKPRAPLPNMLGLAQTSRSNTPVSRKNSTLGPTPEPGHTRNPSTGSNNLLFQNIDAIETSSQISIESDSPRVLETGVTQMRDTEGAILKHVLRDM